MNFAFRISVIVICAAVLTNCAGTSTEASTAAAEAPKSLNERLNQGGGYKQNEDGSWVPKSDKRSEYDSQRESPYFKGKVDKKDYKTGDYAKKSWWGADKDYGRKSYEGNTDGSRFQTTARQDGQMSRLAGQQASLSGPFETNTLDRKSARESSASAIPRPTDAAVQSQRGKYKAPSIIDWREQRSMSVDQSRGILGR